MTVFCSCHKNFLGYSDQADLLDRGLQGLSWKLGRWCFAEDLSIPVVRDLSLMDLRLRLSA